MEYYITQENETTKLKTYVDLDYIDFEEKEMNRTLAWAFIKMHQSDENGWCHEDECLELYSVSDTLIEKVQETCHGHAVGIKIHDGWFEVYFYMDSAKGFENSVKEVLREANYISFEAAFTRDAKWDNYFHELLPDARASIQMQNREIVEALLCEDDDLSIARQVEHYCFFQTASQEARCTERMLDAGFVYKDKVEDKTSEYPYGVALTQKHDVLLETAESMSDTILDLIKPDHGVYTGWSTTLAVDIVEEA